MEVMEERCGSYAISNEEAKTMVLRKMIVSVGIDGDRNSVEKEKDNQVQGRDPVCVVRSGRGTGIRRGVDC